MSINKKPTNKNQSFLNLISYNSARDAFYSLLQTPELLGRKVLLPGYIGYSSREGSGVFDPVLHSGNDFEFYHLDKDLHIDIRDIKLKISNNPNSVLLIIHYFGFVDDNIDEIRIFAKNHDVVVVDDCAHAYFTVMNGGLTNYKYAIFSLHKMFPVEDGGLLLINDIVNKYELLNCSEIDLYCKISKYNTNEIISIRIRNYNYILDKLIGCQIDKKLIIMYPDIGCNVPQTFPILLENCSLRDSLYFELNKMGYGVVSLYHELISCIPETYVIENDLSNRIINLPVHQDATIDELDKLMNCLIKALGH